MWWYFNIIFQQYNYHKLQSIKNFDILIDFKKNLPLKKNIIYYHTHRERERREREIYCIVLIYFNCNEFLFHLCNLKSLNPNAKQMVFSIPVLLSSSFTSTRVSSLQFLVTTNVFLFIAISIASQVHDL